MLRILLYRHAAAASGAAYADDAARPLSEAGCRDAVAMGPYLAGLTPAIDLVLCSAARRAQETWELAAEAFESGPAVAIEDGLYLAGENALLARLRALPDDVATVLIVGHNPGLRQFGLMLAGHGAEAPRAALQRGFPTAALARLLIGCRNWRELKAGDGELVDVQVMARG